METRLLVEHEPVPALGGHVVRALLTLHADAPAAAPGAAPRVPLDLALVLDRSGSMAGEPLAAARQAAAGLVRRLRPEDVVSVVAYDDEVRTVAHPATGADQAALPRAIQGIEAGGSTNLSGGWLRGRELVAGVRAARGAGPRGTPAGDDGALHRVVLLTDGLANCGITDPAALVGLCREARRQGITTTTIGFGPDYDEALLRAMADAGGGNAYYVERPDQAADVFAEEVDGLLALAAQNVAVEVQAWPGARLVQIHHDWPGERGARTARLELGDLYAREPKAVLLELFVAAGTRPPAGVVAELVVHAHVIGADGSVERCEITLPVAVALDGPAHAEPAIRRELVLLDAARARQAALDARARGDLAGGAAVLRAAAAAVDACPAPPGADGQALDHELAGEGADLRAMADRYGAGDVSAADAKYLGQMAYATHRGKTANRRLLRRDPGTPGR